MKAEEVWRKLFLDDKRPAVPDHEVILRLIAHVASQTEAIERLAARVEAMERRAIWVAKRTDPPALGHSTGNPGTTEV